MSYYCENCGNKLSDDARFCDSCGHKVSGEELLFAVNASKDKSEIDLFSSLDWETDWRKATSGNCNDSIGIILTNTENCNFIDLGERYYKILRNYIEYCQLDGMKYFVLDMHSQKVYTNNLNKLNSVEFVVNTLKYIYKCGAFDYLMILGDRDAIPSIQWENKAGDSDEIVHSDLCYATLEINSPFDVVSKNTLYGVGRIPSSCKNGFVEAIKYLENILNNNPKTIHPVAISADEWKKVSNINFNKFGATVYACPPFSFVHQEGALQINNSEEYNFLCFNLHGSSSHDYWVSGDGTKGFSPECLSKISGGYLICTEACYGAKPMIRQGVSQSVLMTAMQTGCIAFLGSTEIAYGIPDAVLEEGADPCAADILVGHFAQYACAGDTIGQAYQKALADLIYANENMMPEDIKTIASFALYGDPSRTFVQKNNKFNINHHKDLLRKDIVFPNVRLAVNMRLVEVNKQISDKISTYVNSFLKDFSSICPIYYAVVGYEGYKASFKKETSDGVENLNIYLNNCGQVTKVYRTK